VPVTRGTDSIDPGSVAPTAPPQSSPLASAYRTVAPKLDRPDEPLSKAKPVETPTAITGVPLEELEPSPTAEVLKEAARSAESPAPVDDLDFPRSPRESEDNKATVPMYSPQAADREEAEDDRRGAAPAAVGVSLAALAALGILGLLLAVGGVVWWQSQRSPPTTVKIEAPAPKIEAPAPPPPPPVAPAEPAPVDPVVVDEVPIEPPVVEPAPATPAPVTPAVATSGTKPTTPPPATPPKPTTPTKPGSTPTPASPWGTTTTPSTPTSAVVTSDNPWGAPADTSVGTLRITSDPSGAAVYVDDKPQGTTPASIELSYGKHRVRLSLAGHRTESSDISLNVKEMSVPFRLTAEQANGIINVFGPTGASVWIDDHDMGPLPVSVQVREGIHTLKLVQADGNACSSSRDVRFAGGGRPLAINLAACQ
jgi:hypothetical protein